MFQTRIRLQALWVIASFALAAGVLAPAQADAQSCDQLFAKYQQNNFNWWWGAFGNCKTGPGGTTDPAAIFECAWNQIPASDGTACLRAELLKAARTREGIDAVIAYNAFTCDQLFAKYQQNNFNWWWGALGNCKTGPGGITDPTAIFNCAWNQVPMSERTACLRSRLLTASRTNEGIAAVVDYNKPPSCDQLFAKYQQNNFNWWWGAFGNCKTGPGGITDPTAIFNCAWNQVPPADQTACLKEKLRLAARTNDGINAVVDYNKGPSCDQLFAKYQQSNFNWWWGALGNCKTGPGGIIDPTAIFDCAWNQLPPADQTACLKERLRLAARTKDGIDAVAEFNKPLSCDQLFAKYEQNNFNWWWGALGNCKTGPGGLIDPNQIFDCAWGQVPANDRTDCLKQRLRGAPRTNDGIDVVVDFNKPFSCDQLFAKYEQNNFNWWWGAFGNCKTTPGGPTDHNAIFSCAWNQVPVNDRTACLKERLLTARRTIEAIADVVAFNGALSNNRTMVSFTTCANPRQGCPEACELPTDGSVPAQYFAPLVPLSLVDGVLPSRSFNDPPAHNIGANEGRLRADLRAAARLADPLGCTLPLAAIHYGQSKIELGQAYADLSVTGRNAFKKFRGKNNPPGEEYCRRLPAQPLATGCLPPVDAPPDDDKLVAGCRQALDRAYAVANFLRTGQSLQANPTKESDRRALGWIAVSGEDDSPHRPVNVPSSDFPQFDLDVDVEAPLAKVPFAIRITPTVRVATRYVIAQSKPTAQAARPTIGRWKLAPDAVPTIPASSEIMIFVHGMDSRAEEANDITKALFRLARNSPKNLVVIAVDLPSSGYAENLDFDRVSSLSEIGGPKWTPLPVPVPVPPELMAFLTAAFAVAGLPPPPPIIPPGTPLPDFGATGKTPLLDFMEAFVVRFVEKLDSKVPIRNNIRTVMGGSLGGSLSFRLGRRPNLPWLQSVIVWSPASIWTSLGEGADIFKHIAPRSAWENANNRDSSDPNDLGPKRIELRAAFFKGWDKPVVPLLINEAQSDTWTSKYWPCKQSSIAAARLDRHETYDPRFLSWRWRLGAEQLLYSHQTIDPTTKLPRFMANDKRMLLACGTEDNVKFNDICTATQKTAVYMTKTPGKALFLDKTGHSLDNERPQYWAQQVLDFLGLQVTDRRPPRPR